MNKLVDGQYKVSLAALTNAVSKASEGVFVDKADRQRLSSRVMAEVEKTLVLLPVDNTPEPEPQEIPVLDEHYRAAVESCVSSVNAMREYSVLKVEARMFQQAWEKAHVYLDCADLMWAGWDAVLNRLITFMDQQSDGNPIFVMLLALQQWRARLNECGIKDTFPEMTPYLHFHVEVKAGCEEHIRMALHEVNCECLLNHMHKLGANHDRNRYLLTVLSNIPARRVHNLLKMESVTRLVGGKLDFSA